MGKIISLLARVSRYRVARSTDSEERPRLPLASVVPLRSRRPRTQVGCGRAETTSQHVDKAGRVRGPSGPETTKFQICLEGLAFHDSIMDDKSMQLWTNDQLTSGAEARRIAHVTAGRPKEPVGPAAYRAAFIKRVRAARALYTENPPEMALALGVERDTYYRYEKRLMMPHHLIPRFCEITGVTVQWLIEGPEAARAMRQPMTATGTESR